MTESEWLTATDPQKLLAWLFNTGSDFTDDQFEALVQCRLLHCATLDGGQGPASYFPVVARLDDDRPRQVCLVHDIFGNPFRPVTADPAWLTSDVTALAEGIYQDRAFDRLPILADALQDTGCDNDDVLNHCRSEGPHVKGCWLIDMLTGRK